jgi:mRNA interferase MazF
MRFGMMIQRAEIVGIPFPFSDMSTQKRRPVLVLTNPDQQGDFTGLAVTSVLTKEKSFCIGVESMRSGEIPKTSWVRYDKIFTLSSSLVKKRYGILENGVFKKIVERLCDHLGCG